MKNIRINKKFILYLLASPFYQKLLINGNKSTTIPMITQKYINNICVPLPSEYEQNEIVSEIESRFSVIDKVEVIVESALLKSEQLKMSILKSAFEGKLVRSIEA